MDTKTQPDSFETLLKEAPEVLPTLPLGSKLLKGRFVVQRILGTGGMGTVYQAKDSADATVVALKVLTRVDGAGVYRLKQEFRSLLDVIHPNLVKLYELYHDNGQWFFTMELVPGQSLLERLDAESQEAELRLVFSELAKGIVAIHDAGKLHRDLKPSNVLITPDNRVVVMDFGLVSEQISGGVGQTATDEGVMGTPLYMAPEQAAREPSTPASDWYAFGVMLYQALAGKPPFTGTISELLKQKREQDASDLSSIAQNIPEDLSRLTMELLSRDPKKRPDGNRVLRLLGTSHLGPGPVISQVAFPFVGREQELNALQQALEETDKGQPVAMFVGGLSGIGKTALLSRFLTRLKREGRAVVLEGRCYERESVPFKTCDGIIDALSRYLKQLPPERAALLLPRHTQALAHVFPALQRLEIVRHIKTRHPLPLDPSELRHMAFAALKELLAKLAEQQNLLLAVDDLHWSDVDGAKLLASLLASPNAPPLLLVGTYRMEELEDSPWLEALLQQLSRLDNARFQVLQLGELDKEKSKQLAEKLLSGENLEWAESIAVESEGSPFIITELCRYTSSDAAGSDQINVVAAIRNRVSSLTYTEREILEAVSISARAVGLPLLQAVMKNTDVTTPLRSLHSQNLISFAGSTSSRVKCYHDRIREVVVAELSPEQQQSWHARLAEALEKTDTLNPVLLFQHYQGAGQLKKAGTYAALAADSAAESLAFEKAAQLYATALKLNPGDKDRECILQTKLGDSEASADKVHDAHLSYLAASRLAAGMKSNELCYKAALQALLGGDHDAAKRLLQKALPHFGLTWPDNQLQAVAMMVFLLIQTFFSRPKIPKKSRAVSQEIRRQIDICSQIAYLLYFDSTVLGLYFMILENLLRLRSKNAEMMPTAITFSISAKAVRHPERSSPYAKAIESAISSARQTGSPADLASTLLGAGFANYHLGKGLTAYSYLRESEKLYLKQCSGVNAAMRRRYIHGLILAPLYHVGDYETMRRTLNDIRPYDFAHKYAYTRLLNIVPISTERLAADASQEAIELTNPMLKEMNPDNLGFLDSKFVVAYGLIKLYSEQPEIAFDWLTKNKTHLRKTGMLRFKLAAFAFFHWLRASAALALSISRNDKRGRLAQKEIKSLSKIKFIPAAAAANGIAAGLALHQGREEESIRLLKLSTEQFAGHEMPNWAACARRSLGLVIGGDEGQAIVAEADRALNHLGVKNPARWANMYFPGFDLKTRT